IGIEINGRIEARNDVHIVRLASASSYCLLVLAAQQSISSVHLKVDIAGRISETLDGKGKLDFDFSYPLMSQTGHELMQLPFAINDFDVRVRLPRKYDEADVGLSSLFRRESDNTFILSYSSNNTIGKSWISFPNPSQRDLDQAKFIFSL